MDKVVADESLVGYQLSKCSHGYLNDSNYIKIPVKSRYIYWGNIKYDRKNTLKDVGKKDSVVIFLPGATGLTIDKDSWKHIASLHKHNAVPTKVVIFENEWTRLGKSGQGRRLGGGGWLSFEFEFEFELPLIAQHMENLEAPEIYKLLYQTWENTVNSRMIIRKGVQLKARCEGKGRMINRGHKTPS